MLILKNVVSQPNAERCPCPPGHAVLRHAFKQHTCSHTHDSFLADSPKHDPRPRHLNSTGERALENLVTSSREDRSGPTTILTAANLGFDAQESRGGHPLLIRHLATSFGTVGQRERRHRATAPHHVPQQQSPCYQSILTIRLPPPAFGRTEGGRHCKDRRRGCICLAWGRWPNAMFTPDGLYDSSWDRVTPMTEVLLRRSVPPDSLHEPRRTQRGRR